MGAFYLIKGYAQAVQGKPQGSLSGAQDRTATAQNGLVTTHIKWRDTQVSKRKWTLERSRFAAEYTGIRSSLPSMKIMVVFG